MKKIKSKKDGSIKSKWFETYTPATPVALAKSHIPVRFRNGK